MKQKLGILFLIFSLILATGIYFFSGKVVKSVLIKTGQRYAEAKVDIDDVTVSFIPLGISITGINVADKNSPMQNLISIDEIKGNIHVSPLFKGKVIIDTLAIENAKNGTARQFSGALKQKKTEKAGAENVNKGSSAGSNTSSDSENEKPVNKTVAASKDFLANDVDYTALLDKKELFIEKDSKLLESSIKEKQAYWNNFTTNNPINGELEILNQRAKKLKDINFSDLKNLSKNLNEVKAVANDYSKLLSEVNTTQQQLQNDISSIQSAYDNLSKSKDKDINGIINEFSVNHFETKRISSALLGESLTTKLSSLLNRVSTVKDKLPKVSNKSPEKSARNNGQTIVFPVTKKGLPTLWIKEVILSGEGKDSISGKITNITSHQGVIDKTTKIDLTIMKSQNDVQNEAQNEKYRINSDIDFRNDKSKISLSSTGKNTALKGFSILKGSQPLTIKSGRYDSQLNILLIDSTLAGNINLIAGSFTYNETFSKNDSSLAAILSQSLNSGTKFDVSLKGSITSPKLGISSTLDKQLKDAIANLTNAKIKENKIKLENALNERLKAEQAKLKPLLDSLNKNQNALNDSKEAISNSKKQLKEQENKVNSKLKSEQKKAEQQAIDAVKNQLKNLF